MASSEKTSGNFSDYERAFRTHHSDTYGGADHGYAYYEPAYRHGFRYGSRAKHRDRDYASLEEEVHRSYEKEHGADTFSDVRQAARYGFRRGRHHLNERNTRSDEENVKGPSGSSQTASGDPGSVVRQSEEKTK